MGTHTHIFLCDFNEKHQLKTQKNRVFVSAILVFVLIITVFLTIAPTVKATKINTSASMSISPTTIDVIQQIFITGFFTPPTNNYQNIVLDILDPNGNYFSIRTVSTDNTGKFLTSFYPETEGSYTLFLNYPGETIGFDEYSSCSAQISFLIGVPPSEDPIALFSYHIVDTSNGETIAFEATGSYDPDGGSIVSCAWDFGDGSTGSG